MEVKNMTEINNKMLINKKAHINKMITELKNNQKVTKRVGGYTVENAQGDLDFQLKRLKVLEWAEGKTREQIITKIRKLESQISKEELNCKYGITRGLTAETLEIISQIELLEVTIDEHGKHEGGWE